MRTLVRFLLIDRPVFLLALLGAGTLILAALFVYMCGAFGTPDFSDTQNTEFRERLVEQPYLPAIAAAGEVDTPLPDDAAMNAAAPVVTKAPSFAPAVRDDLAAKANSVRRDPSLQLGYTLPDDAANRAWKTTYLCGLTGWEEYRSVVRALVVRGYGKCSAASVFAARSPTIYAAGGTFWGWFQIFLTASLALGLFSGFIALLRFRAAYRWLYTSSVMK